MWERRRCPPEPRRKRLRREATRRRRHFASCNRCGGRKRLQTQASKKGSASRPIRPVICPLSAALGGCLLPVCPLLAVSPPVYKAVESQPPPPGLSRVPWVLFALSCVISVGLCRGSWHHYSLSISLHPSPVCRKHASHMHGSMHIVKLKMTVVMGDLSLLLFLFLSGYICGF